MTPTTSEREARLPGYVLTAIKSMEPHHQTTVLEHIAALTRQEAQQEAPVGLMKCICTGEGAGCSNKCDRGQLPPIPAERITITGTQQECPKCGGTGGERWREVDGSENGERCDACDGFGTQQEAQGAVDYEARISRGDIDRLTLLIRMWGLDEDKAKDLATKLVFVEAPYTPPAPVDVRVVEDPSGFSAEMVLDEADNWTARHTGAEMLRNYAALLDGQQAGVDAELARYFASGPEGEFWTNDMKFAEALIRKSNHPDDWTITNTAALGGGGRP